MLQNVCFVDISNPQDDILSRQMTCHKFGCPGFNPKGFSCS